MYEKLPGKKFNSDNHCTVEEYFLFCDHSPNFDDFLSLATDNFNDFKVALKENVLINGGHPLLNKNKQFLSLELSGNQGCLN